MLCEVSRGEQVFSLTKLRRHQDNYHVPNTDPARPDFVLNICGPLVTADVNSSSCNPHSACALVDNEYMVLVTSSTYFSDAVPTSISNSSTKGKVKLKFQKTWLDDVKRRSKGQQ